MTKNGVVNASLLREFQESLDPRSRESLMAAADAIVEVKKRGGNIAVVTGSGPNIHEGVTTLIAVFSLLLFAGDTLAGFATALAIGVFVGTYSSIFVASSIALDLKLSARDLMPAQREKGAVDDMP